MQSKEAIGRGDWRGAALLLAIALVLLAGSGRTSVFDRDEARFALAVREMRERGELVLPTNWGEPRYHKPILAYWLALASERVLGENELAWRLPSAAAGLVAVAATMALARRRFGARVALRAGIVLGTSLVFVVEAKILTADALLLATTTLAFWAWMELREGSERVPGWRLLFWIAVALGILAKGVNVFFLAAAASALAYLRSSRRRGPLVLLLVASAAAAVPAVSILGPVLFALLAAWVLVRARRERATPRARLGASWGVPLCLALVAAWFVPALARSGGAFLSEGVGHHMLERGASAFEGHRGFPGYYVLAAVLVLFPWAAWAPAALVSAWRDPRREFLLAWVLGPWALLECMASKLPHYLLVALPALAVLVALEWERPASGGPRGGRFECAVERVIVALPCLVLAAAGVWLWRGSPELHGAALLLIGAALAFAAAELLALRRSDGLPFQLALAGALALYLLLCAVVRPRRWPCRPPRRLAAESARLARPSEPIHLVHFRPASLGCYLPAGHPIVEDQTEVGRALAAGRPGLYVVEAERAERVTGDHPLAWERLTSVRGLPGLGPEEVLLLRVSSTR